MGTVYFHYLLHQLGNKLVMLIKSNLIDKHLSY